MAARPGQGVLVAGIDAGTTRIRTLVFALDGALAAQGAAPTPIETRTGRADFDPAALWAATRASIRQATGQIDDPARIRAVAVASVGESGVALDAGLSPLARALAWYDQSPQPQSDALAARIDVKGLHMTCGLRLSALAGLSKMLWLRDQDPGAFAQTRHWLNVADYIAFRLSGEIATDFSLAGRMACLDLAAGGWNDALLADIGINPAMLPPLRDNGAPLGTIGADRAAETGLPADCLVAAGGHDHIVGALASGVFGAGALLDSLGTAEALLLPMPEAPRDPRIVEWELVASRLRINGRALDYVCGDLATASASIEWFRGLVGETRGYDATMRAAAAVAPGAEGVVFLPHLRVGSPPDRRPGPAGAFLHLSADSGRAALYRAVLEGLAFDARNIRDHLLLLLPRAARAAALKRPITVIGGGARNALLLDIKAAAFDAPLAVLQSDEAVSLGAAMLAALGAGLFDDLDAAVAAMRGPAPIRRPDPGLSACYARLFRDRYLPAAAAMRGLGR